MNYEDDGPRLERDDHQRKRRPPPVATPAHLEATAQAYVEKFWGPAANLRRVLQRHVAKSVQFHGTDPVESAATVQAIVQRFCESGLVDDGRFAEAAARTLHGRGKSRRLIAMSLRAKGLGDVDVTAALATLDADPELDDKTAAWALARRRRLGPYRKVDRVALRQKDLQAILRVGFSFDIARAVIDGELP